VKFLTDWLPIVLLIFFAFLWAYVLNGCTTVKKSGAPLTSLCIMDFESYRCWVNKTQGKGPTFDEMKAQQATCLAGKDQPCWYGITSPDLKRIINK
jgi:hypothetical protein